MGKLNTVYFLVQILSCVSVVWTNTNVTEKSCIIDLECEECLPEHMPLVSTSGALAHGAQVTLDCGGGRLLAAPDRARVEAVCHQGRFRTVHDNVIRHLRDLGCQENVFEDVAHHVDECSPPLSGRSYQLTSGGRHLAQLCYDLDGARVLRAFVSSATLPAHAHRDRPLSLLGNFNHMFDAKTRTEAHNLYSNDRRMNKRLHELLKHDKHCFAAQVLTTDKLLSSSYFEKQYAKVTDFASNRIPVWASISEGNWKNLQKDVVDALERSRGNRRVLDVYAGTHKVATVRADSPVQLYLKPEKRFPVPMYMWTLVIDPLRRKGVALVILNDPFVAVSEIKEAVFCESGCGKLSWLKELNRNRNYETPARGLVFCCNVHEFADRVSEMAKGPLESIPRNETGMLMDI